MPVLPPPSRKGWPDRRKRRGQHPGQSSPDSQHTFSFSSDYEFLLFGHIVQEFLNLHATELIPNQLAETAEFSVDTERSVPVHIEGGSSFLYQGRVHTHAVDNHPNRHVFRSSGAIAPLVDRLRSFAKSHNPLRGKHLQLRGGRGELTAHFHPVPRVALSEVSLPAGVPGDLLDNTVLHLRHLPGVNGLIFHGPPGTGKSVTCQALVRECLQAGFSSCFLNSRVDFDQLGDFVRSYLAPCLLILEDVDNFGEDRLHGRGHDFSDFLQFLSGLSEHPESITVIATTNHYDLLDEAIRDRPVRFNRHYRFDKPGRAALAGIFRSRFDGLEPPAGLLRRSEELSFTGAHFAELHRTATLLSFKTGKPLAECLEAAFETIVQHFGDEAGPLGFTHAAR